MSDRPDGSPTAVDVLLRPEWAAVEATDKTFVATGDNKAFGESISVSYVVPAGKTLYIVQASFALYANLAADADKQHTGWLVVWDSTAVDIFAQLGGNAGGQATFPKPVVVPAGDTFQVVLTNKSNHACDLEISATGYEL